MIRTIRFAALFCFISLTASAQGLGEGIHVPGINMVTGDCTTSGSGSVAIVCTKTNGVNFGSAAILGIGTGLTSSGGNIVNGSAAVTGAVRSNGSGTYTQAACADISNASVYCPAVRGQLPGTTTNDAATSGNIGEYVQQALAQGSAVSLTSGIPANVTSIPLTAGDWDVSGIVCFTGNAATQVQGVIGAVNSASATLPTSGMTSRSQFTYSSTGSLIFVGGATTCQSITQSRMSLSGSGTAYLIGYSDFTTNTAAAFGQILARRVR